LWQYGSSLFLSQGCKRSHFGVGGYRYRNTNLIKIILKRESKTMKAYVGVELQLYLLLTPTINRGEWSASRSSPITPGKAPHLPSKKEAERAPEPLWTLCRTESFLSLPKVQPPLARIHYMCLFPKIETDARLGYYAAPKFRDHLSVPSSRTDSHIA
jgi:hypothetical protein